MSTRNTIVSEDEFHLFVEMSSGGVCLEVGSGHIDFKSDPTLPVDDQYGALKLSHDKWRRLAMGILTAIREDEEIEATYKMTQSNAGTST